MKTRPILFSGPMMRAILAGTKTQTRRIVKPQPAHSCRYEMNGAGTHALHLAGEGGDMIFVPPTAKSVDHRLPCPYGVPGDRLYVKESAWLWCDVQLNGTTPTGRQKLLYVPIGDHVHYQATESRPTVPAEQAAIDRVWRLKIGRFLPRRFSRITLEVAGVRVERLQAITEDDANAEGVEPETVWGGRAAFEKLWDKINGDRAAWASNPWVWVVSFRRVERT